MDAYDFLKELLVALLPGEKFRVVHVKSLEATEPVLDEPSAIALVVLAGGIASVLGNSAVASWVTEVRGACSAPMIFVTGNPHNNVEFAEAAGPGAWPIQSGSDFLPKLKAILGLP